MLSMNVMLCLFVFFLSPSFSCIWAILALIDSGFGRS